MEYVKEIEEYKCVNIQEEQDKKVILDYIKAYPHNILLRENEFAHITSSGFILNEGLDKVLMVHHNIRDTWGWTGGHADGDTDFLYVAIKEAKEESGIKSVEALGTEIASIDILPVYGHMKNGAYISAHQHLSVAYLLIAKEEEELIVKPDENTAVRWFSLEELNEEYYDKKDLYVYNKLIAEAKRRKVQIDNNK